MTTARSDRPNTQSWLQTHATSDARIPTGDGEKTGHSTEAAQNDPRRVAAAHHQPPFGDSSPEQEMPSREMPAQALAPGVLRTTQTACCRAGRSAGSRLACLFSCCSIATETGKRASHHASPAFTLAAKLLVPISAGRARLRALDRARCAPVSRSTALSPSAGDLIGNLVAASPRLLEDSQMWLCVLYSTGNRRLVVWGS
ncbi:unnamed protein product [Diplocarpon coronariae]|nr:hypothetical protein JHW43_005964 [Diplocarpon mali]